MTGKFEQCISDGVASGAIDKDLGDAAKAAYGDAYAEAAQTLGADDADRAAGRAVLTALEKAAIEKERMRSLMVRSRRDILEGIAGLKERRGYTDVQALGGAGGKPPKDGWVQGGEPPEGGPLKGGGIAAKALPLLMRNKGGLSGAPFKGSVEGRFLAIRGLSDAKMADIIEKFQSRLGFDTPNRASSNNIVREAFGENTGDVAAKSMAQSWAEASEMVRRMFNAAGGSIGHIENWGLPQSHDAAAIYKMGRDAWIQFTQPLLSREKMIDRLTGAAFTEKRLQAVLGQTWDRIVTHGLIDKQPSDTFGQGSMAMTRGQERFLIYKDAASWQAYQARAGVADAYTAMMNHLDDMAHDTALMQVLGPNPEHQWGWLKKFAEREAAVERKNGNEGAERAARRSIGRAQDMYDGYTGAAGVPVDERLAKAGATIRSYLNGADLGGAILTDMPSAPVFGAMARSFMGIKLQGDMGQFMSLLADPAVRADARRMGFVNEVAREGLVNGTQDSLRSLTAGEKTVDGMNALARTLPTTVMRMEGLSGMFEARKRSFRMSFMGALHDASSMSLDKLAASGGINTALAQELTARGFTAADWDAIRATPAWTPRPGVSFLRPTDIAAHASEELALRVGEMVLNGEQYAVPVSSSLWTRAALLGGARPGTLKGEGLRSFLMFKTFLVNAQYLYAEETYLRGVSQGFTGGRLGLHMGAWAAGAMGALTLSGSMTLQLKQLARGQDPLPMDTPQFWGAAMMQGGGFGILGDFFYSAHARNDKAAPIVAMGPTGQLASDAWDATAGQALDKINHGQHPKAKDHEPARIAHDLASYTPGASLWWARTAFDRDVVDQLQQMMDPDAKPAFQRAARQQEKQSGAGAWWPRGEPLPTRAPNMANVAGAPGQ